MTVTRQTAFDDGLPAPTKHPATLSRSTAVAYNAGTLSDSELAGSAGGLTCLAFCS